MQQPCASESVSASVGRKSVPTLCGCASLRGRGQRTSKRRETDIERTSEEELVNERSDFIGIGMAGMRYSNLSHDKTTP